MPYCTTWPVMSPLRWIQSTALHWMVVLEEVTLDTLTNVGGADGTERERFIDKIVYFDSAVSLQPVSPVIPVTGSLTALPAAFDAVTVIM